MVSGPCLEIERVENLGMGAIFKLIVACAPGYP
jgi:hypothetical protein